MAKSTFSAKIREWALKVDGAVKVIFQESAQELVSQMDDLLVEMVYAQPPSPSGYKRTGFLRASLMASKEAIPGMIKTNPGRAVPADLTDIVLVINDAELGDTIYLGYTANYASFVHYGANGRPPKPWITLAAQRWKRIVAAKATEVKKRLGL